RPSGALRPCACAQRQGKARRGARPAARDRAPRPQMERRRCAQAAGAAVRGLGTDRRRHGRRAAPPVIDPVRLSLPSGAAGLEQTMPMNVVYRGPADLPQVIPVFPLAGALLLPRGQMPLNIFEPRYLEMIDDTLADRHRLIGIIQPDASRPGLEAAPRLYKVGGVGRITQFAETGDGRYLIQLTGIVRFRIEA